MFKYMPFIKGQSSWNKGLKLSEEHRRKLKEAKLKNPTRYWLGKKRSEATKKKMKLFQVGRIPWNKGKKRLQVGWNKGKKMSPEFGKAISKRQMGRIPWNKGLIGFQAREKHYNWQGGITNEPYSFDFNKALKEKIRKRDNYTCRECKYTEEKLGYTLVIHHIDYDKKNNNPINLISLCRNCHSQTNFNRLDWTNYFKQLTKTIL